MRHWETQGEDDRQLKEDLNDMANIIDDINNAQMNILVKRQAYACDTSKGGG